MKKDFHDNMSVAGVCPTQLTLSLTDGAGRSPQMSSLKRGVVCARACRVPHLGKPFVNGTVETTILCRVRRREPA